MMCTFPVPQFPVPQSVSAHDEREQRQDFDDSITSRRTDVELHDRLVTWLGCSDAEIDELQRALNNGSNLNGEVLPGVLVVDDYFAVADVQTLSSSSELASGSTHQASSSTRPARVPSSEEAPPDLWNDPAAYVFYSLLDVANACATRSRSCHPCPGRFDGSDFLKPQAREEEEDDIFPMPSIGRVLEMMRLECHLLDCISCGQCILGKRLKCMFCLGFSLCEACYSKPMHWPDAPLPAHLDANPGHKFTKVVLPTLLCPAGHEVEPGDLEESEWPSCESCEGPLHNGVLPAWQGPQYRCIDSSCGFALCVGCYWANRQMLQDDVVEKVEGVESDANTPAAHHGSVRDVPDVRELPEVSCDSSLLQPPLRCHTLFSSPLCVGHTIRVQMPSVTALGDINQEVESWGVEFAVNHPFMVSAVQSCGRLAAWNEKQEAMQNLVREGDTLVQISFAGVAVKVNGASPVTALQRILTQHLSRSGGEQLQSVESPIDLFFSGMRSLPQLRIDDEISVLQGTGCDFLSHAATTDNIRGLIAAGECRILHFSFHTSSDESRRVFLEDPHGKAHVLTSEEFQALLLAGDERQHIALVFISSCHSFSLGRDIASAGVRHVVCVRDEHSVLDSSCRLFARHFFISLGAGRSVRQAFDFGVAALKASPYHRVQEDCHKFALLPEDADHDECFVSGSSSKPAPKTPPCQELAGWGSLPARAEDFVGREFDVHRLLMLLRSESHERRLVLLCGDPGMGKSALMAEVGRFVLSRQALFDEVRWLTGQDCEQGLEDLYRRTLGMSRWRVLLLIDNALLVSWRPVRRLLSVQSVHIVVAVSMGSRLMVDLDIEAVNAGVKPVRFLLGPPDSLAQAQMFLGRAARELYASEVHPPHSQGISAADKVWSATRPADYIGLAMSRLIHPLGGNPRRIVEAAQALTFSDNVPRILESRRQALNDNTAEGDLSGGPARPHLKVRLILPDGREKCEWLPPNMLIRDVLKERSPSKYHGTVTIFVEGCLVQPDMCLASFGKLRSEELLLVELRECTADG